MAVGEGEEFIGRKVRVQKVTQRENGWRVRWVVDGRKHRQETFPTRDQAERFRSDLLTRAGRGDDITAYDRAVKAQDSTKLWEWARSWWVRRWEHNSAKTRESDAEMIVAVVSAAVTVDPKDPAAARRWIRTVICARPDAAAGPLPPDLVEVAKHMNRTGLLLADLTRGSIVEQLWEQLGQNIDGSAAAVTTAKRRRNLFKRMIDDAVRAGVMVTNPMGNMERSRARVAHRVDVDRLPPVGETEQLLGTIAEQSRTGRSCYAYYTLMLHTGCRPSEAAGLLVEDCVLPEVGDEDILFPPDDLSSVAAGTWKVTFRRASPRANRRFTDSGGDIDERQRLKWRADGEARPVELTPRAAWTLAAHLRDSGATAGPVFPDVRDVNVSRRAAEPWRRAVRARWAEGHPYRRFRTYDMRHVHATALLEAGWDTARVAQRLGCSIDVLLNTYQGVLGDRMRDRERDLLREAFGG